MISSQCSVAKANPSCSKTSPGHEGFKVSCTRHSKHAHRCLSIHDRYAVSPEELILLLAGNIDHISKIRLDSICWGTNQLENFFALLTTKKIEELLIVNCAWPMLLVDVPLGALEGSQVQILRVCFFRIPELVGNDFPETLVVFDISHCSVDTQLLYEFIVTCTSLKEIHIGFHQSNLKLKSNSVKLIQIWMSNMEYIHIEDMPSLTRFVASASPNEPRKMLKLQLRHSPALKAITCNLSNQCVVINSIDIRMDIGVACSCLRELSVGVKFFISRQRRYLVNSLKCLTHLEILTVWRMDKLSPNENPSSANQDWTHELGTSFCLQHLRVFTLEGYKGGDLEASLARAILENSSSLEGLTIEFDSDLPDELLQKLKKSILMVNSKSRHKVSIRIRKDAISCFKGSRKSCHH